MIKYKILISEGTGLWFGAFIDGKMVGSLGLFADGNIARFQIVSTDPIGVCSTLVYNSSLYAFENLSAETLVMIADEDYHAAKIYESVGFKITERLLGLCWHDRDKFGGE